MATGWERLATFDGGSVADLAAAQAADGSWHVFAATAVGVFRSVDRGRSWEALMPAVAGVEVVAPSPTFAQDGIVYVGSTSGLHRWDGRNTRLTHLLSGGPVQTIAVVSADAAAVTIFVGTQSDGILVSRDGGRAWAGANAGLLDLSVEGIALSPSFSEDGVAFAATMDGLYRTRNGGEAWRILNLGLDTDDVIVSCVAVSPMFTDDRIVLAGTEDRGLCRSDDGGRSWSRPPELADYLINNLTYLDGGRVIAALDAGLALSDDDGQTWRVVGADLGGVAAASLLPGPSEALLAALPESGSPLKPGWPHTGVARSEDGGVTWQASSMGLTADLITGLALSPEFASDQTVLVLSLEVGLRRSHDGAASWQIVESTAISDGDDEDVDNVDDDDDSDFDDLDVWGVEDVDDDDLALGFEGELAAMAWVSGTAGGTLLAGGSEDGLFLSQDAGESWQPAWSSSPAPPRLQSLATAVTVIAAANSRTGAHVLADLSEPLTIRMILSEMASNGGRGRSLPAPGTPNLLVASRNGGRTWTDIKTPAADGSVVGIALQPDAGLDGAIFVATRDHERGGLTLWRSVYGGQRWHVSYADPELRRDIAAPFVALPANPFGDTVVLGIGDQVLRPRPNAWEVTEGVRRPVWDAVTLTAEDPAGWDVAVAGLAASPSYAKDRTLFAATSAGIFVSRDGAASWTAWSDGLEPAATVAVAVSPAYDQDRLVYALGLGGSVWRRRE